MLSRSSSSGKEREEQQRQQSTIKAGDKFQFDQVLNVPHFRPRKSDLAKFLFQAEVLSVVGKLVTHRIMARVIQLTTMVFLLKEELLEIYGSLS